MENPAPKDPHDEAQPDSQYSQLHRQPPYAADRKYQEPVDHPLEEGRHVGSAGWPPREAVQSSGATPPPTKPPAPPSPTPLDINSIWAMFWIVDARLGRLETQMAAILTAIRSLSKQEKDDMAGLLDQLQPELQSLTDELNHNTDVEDSAVVAINTLVDRVNALVQNATDIATLKADMTTWADTMKQHVDPVAAAIANVPAP